ncbi:endonuclease [Cupriavidus pinatubonensis]|uniref:Endonuclease n=1 Tax=Cupriavidus pinatubonensis TaxID=248026 RepID=A0ABN7YU77_9BURK|nr:endonuclease [Cupriavidus pinatubonensis]CAG9176414.1 hypothetical protein LMG23994_03404 [Cupriavidus pinatubonensis]
MKHLRPGRLLLAAALAAATIPVMAQTPTTPRDPYSQGARVGDKFDPYTQGTNATTRQDLAPDSQPSTVPAQPGAYSQSYSQSSTYSQPGTMSMQRSPNPYMQGGGWDSPNLGQRLGPRSAFLDGS